MQFENGGAAPMRERGELAFGIVVPQSDTLCHGSRLGMEAFQIERGERERGGSHEAGFGFTRVWVR